MGLHGKAFRTHTAPAQFLVFVSQTATEAKIRILLYSLCYRSNLRISSELSLLTVTMAWRINTLKMELPENPFNSKKINLDRTDKRSQIRTDYD
jgi:hypothetical protein